MSTRPKSDLKASNGMRDDSYNLVNTSLVDNSDAVTLNT